MILWPLYINMTCTYLYRSCKRSIDCGENVSQLENVEEEEGEEEEMD